VPAISDDRPSELAPCASTVRLGVGPDTTTVKVSGPDTHGLPADDSDHLSTVDWLWIVVPLPGVCASGADGAVAVHCCCTVNCHDGVVAGDSPRPSPLLLVTVQV
jgi:hypothetical protein